MEENIFFTTSFLKITPLSNISKKVTTNGLFYKFTKYMSFQFIEKQIFKKCRISRITVTNCHKIVLYL